MLTEHQQPVRRNVKYWALGNAGFLSSRVDSLVERQRWQHTRTIQRNEGFIEENTGLQNVLAILPNHTKLHKRRGI